MCHAGRSVPSRHEKLTRPGLPSPNQPNRERAIVYRDGSGPNSRSDAHCAIIVGDWEEPSGESRYNPLDAPEPDLDASVEDRRIGGLGVHFVKTIMDTVNYRRVDDTNQLAMTMRVQQEGTTTDGA